MLNADAYAEIVDRHVELATDFAWLGSLLDSSDPTGDFITRRGSASSPAIQFGGEFDDDSLTDRIVTITQLVEWWAARLGTTVPVPLLQSEPASTDVNARRVYGLD